MLTPNRPLIFENFEVWKYSQKHDGGDKDKKFDSKSFVEEKDYENVSH